MKQLKNFLIKREQSQACLSFAKREKSRLLAKTILTLVALLAVTTGAWAQGPWNSGDCTVTISDDVMTVSGAGAMADYKDTNLTPWYGYTSDVKTIVIESGVTSIGNFDFSRFEKLESVSIPASVTSIGISAFGECGSEATTALTVSFAEGSAPLTIGEVAFRYANLKSIDIPNRVTSIGEQAFYSCNYLESVSIPASVTSIGVGAFSGCGSMAEALTVSFAEGSTPLTIGEGAFGDAKLKSIDFPNRVTSIGNYAFSGCGYLESVSIPASVTTISDGAFSYCGKLANVYIYAPSLTTYGIMAFDGNAAGRKIYVLTDAVDTYKAGWSAYAADIVGDLQPLATGPEVAWDKAKKTGTFTMPGGNVTLEPEYYPQAALTAEPTAINDVPATTDGAIVKAGTVANIGTTETAQGTVMYYVSQTALDDDALLALAADQWKADVPTAESLAQGQAYVYYYVRGNDSDTDEENFSDGDILAANALTVTIAAEPTKVTMAVNDKTMGTAEVAGESKVEWTADTWKGWTSDIKEHTVDDITITGTQKTSIYELTSEDKYKNSLLFFVVKVWDNSTVTFSTTGDPFSRIEFTMIDDYSQYNPNIIPNDNWTVEGKSAVWEGEATKSLTLQSCSTQVSKITFFKGATPDGVTINGDGTFTVAKTATVTLKATPAEGYKFLYWEDDQTNTNPVREVTIESGMADMTYKAVFAEITYNVTFADGTNPDPENPEWTASPAADVKKGQTVTVTYTGDRKVIGVKAEKKAKGNIVDPVVGQVIGSDGKNYAYGSLPTGVTAVAKICYVSGSNGLALALTDEGEMKWSTANETCAAHTPAITGGTWKLPSKDEWDNMISAAGSFTDLRDGFSSVGGTNMESGGYWSSTEKASDLAWYYYFYYGGWGSDDKDRGLYARPVLAF